MIERFADDERGGFFTTSHDHEQLIARRKDLGDHPIPSGNSSAALGLSSPGRADGRWLLFGAGARVDPAARARAVRHPKSFGHLLQALDFHLSPTREVALIAPADAKPERTLGWSSARVGAGDAPPARRPRWRRRGRRAP